MKTHVFIGLYVFCLLWTKGFGYIVQGQSSKINM